ncbi:class I adenylate-forming enzyme family protein [Phytohabitans houttuyneae]|uniref:class I adenylate-forming enzyme family protein n=1 Tax=Phytohabitans houttuyneae TaxID=1076126 RepID=UPI0015646EB4|nr:class I adenylate-forming enzyme family protein [Phytohabitans houttuyneae]
MDRGGRGPHQRRAAPAARRRPGRAVRRAPHPEPAEPRATGRARPAPDDPLDIVFSSGTTGVPKPAVFHHRDWPFRPSGTAGSAVVHCGIPFGTSTGVHGILLRHLAVGALSAAAKDPAQVPDLVERFGCRELVVTPYALRKLLAAGLPPAASSRITTVKVVAGPLSEQLASAAMDAFPAARIFSIYGATELGAAIFTRLAKRGESDVLGVPSPGTKARIVDDHGGVAPPGTVGEIQVSHHAGDPAPAGRSWIGTGDLGYLDERGRVHLVGRAKEIVFLPGGRAVLTEIEERLSGRPYIKDCAVAAIDGAGGWDGLGACVVLGDGGGEPEAFAAVAGIGPPISRVRVVSAIPRTPVGKPIRAELWRLLTAPEAVEVPARG